MRELSFPCPCEFDVPLREKTYYRIGGVADRCALPERVRHLADLLLWNRERRLPLAVMGSGSNMLFSDEQFSGVLLAMERMNRMFWISSEELFCEAGVDNSDVAVELLGKGRSGGEWLYRLPGRIGSTVRMNARCFGGEISAVTGSVVTIRLDGTIRWWSGREIFLGYKQTSLMESREIVLAAVLRFPLEKPVEAIRREMSRCEKERLDRHHFDFPSCGSTFRNNYEAGRPSGTIFEELGFKGRRRGGAVVSEHHANFIYNTGSASSGDVLALAAAMKREAREKAGVDLDLEMECAGLFPNAELEACGVVSVRSGLDRSKGWAGLLWHPGETVPGTPPEKGFPRTLVQGCLCRYCSGEHDFPPDIGVHVEQLLSLAAAAEKPDEPFLRWTSSPRSGEPFGAGCVPERLRSAEGDFTDNLWQRPVSEFFVGHGGGENRYLEFEMRPSGEWVALRFSGRRQRYPGRLSVTLWQGGLCRFSGVEGSFGMTFSFRLLESLLEDGVLSIQCAASLGKSRYGLFPWWPDTDSKPDFHRPERFCRIRLW